MTTKTKAKPKKKAKAAKAAMKRDTAAEKPDQCRIVFMPITNAGVRVNEDIALTYSAVWSCVRVIAETIASLSWKVLELMPDGDKEERALNPVAWLLHRQANPEQAAGTWRETLMAHALTWGNGYAEIERDGAGRPVNLWTICPDRVDVRRDEAGRLYYDIRNAYGPNTQLAPRDMFHLKGLSFDGVVGYDTVRIAAQSIGLGLAMEQNGSAFFSNGSRPSGMLKYPGMVNPEIIAETEKRWKQSYGRKNAHGVAVVDQGLEYVPMATDNTDAQWNEGRTFQLLEVCRWFRVPPHKLAELSRATFSNIEHQSIEFVTDTIVPWVKRLEQEADMKLFGYQSQGRLFTKLNLQSLLRGDLASRYTAYQTASDRGWLNVNEIRELEDMNGIGPDGDQRFVPMNMQLLSMATETAEANLKVLKTPPAPPAATAATETPPADKPPAKKKPKPAKAKS